MKICYNLFDTKIFSLVLLLLFLSGVFGEQVEVTRQIGFKEDKFTIPSLTCKLKKCVDYKASDAEHPPGCKCTCSAAVSTPGFFFLNGKWQCTSQINIRNQEDCRFHLIPFENKERELYTLSSVALPINLDYKSSRDACKIDVLQSRYMSCDGAWMSLNNIDIKRFELIKPSSNKSQQFQIKVKRHVEGFNLDGRVIKLAFSKECSSNINNKNRCMLFKVEGTFTCPLEQLSPPSPRPVTSSRQPSENTEGTKSKEQVVDGKGKESVKATMKQSGNSTGGGGTTKKVIKNNQDMVFIICGGVALVAVIFIIVIIFNLRRTERRNRRRATAAMAQSAQVYPKTPASHLILVQKADAVSTNGGFSDNASLVTGITDITIHSASSGYSSDNIGSKKAEAVQSINDLEDGIFDPIYENICEKCKDLNLLGPCEHVESYDSDDGPVYVNLADEEESEKDQGEKKLDTDKDSEKGSKEIAEPVVTINKEIPDEVSQKEKREKEKGSSIKASEKSNPNKQKKSNSKRSRRRRKKQASTKSETKVKKQSSTEKPDKQDLIGNIEQEHSENDDIGGEHLYDSVEDSDDDDHVYESVCESSDEDDDAREYYNIDELDDHIEKVKSQSNLDLADSYRDNPPPLPPRPSDDSAEEGSSNEAKDSKVNKALPKKPPRHLGKQNSKEELTDSESEDSPRLPARLYDPSEGNSPTEKNKTEPFSLKSEQIKEKETSSDNANDNINGNNDKNDSENSSNENEIAL